MKKRKIFLIIEAFCSVFPELQLDAKEKQQILNQGMNYDTLIIVPSVSPEKLMFLMEEVIEISSFIMPNQFFSLLDLNRRREEGLYVLYLNEALGEKDESLTLFEALAGFLIGSLSDAYCLGSSLKDYSNTYPCLFYNKEKGGLFIQKAVGIEPFLKKYKIEKQDSFRESYFLVREVG